MKRPIARRDLRATLKLALGKLWNGDDGCECVELPHFKSGPLALFVLTAAKKLSPPVPEKPLIFTAASVLATLAGTKTQTRRLINLGRLRVRLPYVVNSDFSDLFPESKTVAEPGLYQLHGGLHSGGLAIQVGGKGLGIKPGEFDFVCPYVTGTTRLRTGRGWWIEPHGEQRLWVKEAAWIAPADFGRSGLLRDDEGRQRIVSYDATCDSEERRCAADYGVKKSSPIFMPRWASRLTLRIKSVRIERLHDISEADALAEGVKRAPDRGQTRLTAKELYALAWDSIHGPGSWNKNPFVWTIAYSRVA